ncbi:MAG: mechanosensitive ion channel [Candidatus Methanoperedens sp.]|nr:mechanosensitive ion channel [Candidatus Methanoperedens sp.]
MVGDKILIGNVTLENFLIFIFIFLLTVVVGNISYALVRRLLDDKLSLRNSKVIARVIEYTFYTLGFYYGVRYVLNLDLNAFIASLGIFSIALAFGSQQIIQNFIAGLLISVGRPIELEDWVEIGDTGICNIKDIKLTRTVLRNKNGKLFYVPNSVLISTIIINYTKSGFVEIPVPLTIPYTCDFEKVKNIVKEVAYGHAKILPNVSRVEKDIISKLFELSNIRILFKDKLDLSMFEPRVLISDISDSKITLSIRIWIREIDKNDEIVSEFLEKLLEKFKEEKIELK